MNLLKPKNGNLIIGNPVDQAALTGAVIAPTESGESHYPKNDRQEDQDAKQLQVAKGSQGGKSLGNVAHQRAA